MTDLQETSERTPRLDGTIAVLRAMREHVLDDFTRLGSDEPRELRESLPAYIESVVWKLKMLEHNCGLLAQLHSKVEILDSLGMTGVQGELSVDCGHEGGVSVTVRDRDSARTLLLQAFDGVVTASVNAVDTFARMLNLLYNLGVPHDKANLPKVCAKVCEKHPETSPLRLAFAKTAGISWMQPLRRIRGECQHWDIATVLKEDKDGFGAPLRALLVKDEYRLDGMDDLSVASFAETARTGIHTLLREVAGVISVSPATACEAIG
jgi:hypothetical protein